jgi:hypothetical protein
LLVIDLRVGEAVKIGQAVVTLEEKSGKVARLPINRVQPTTAAQVAKNGLAPMMA